MRQLFDWSVCNILHIIFFYVTAADIDSQRALLDDRFVSARNIPGTRDNHSFVPMSHTDMKVSRVSGEEVHFMGKQCNMDVPVVQGRTILPFQPGTYVASTYDGHWWLGCIARLQSSCNLVGQRCHSAGQRMMTYVGLHMHMCYALFRSHEQQELRDNTKFTMQPVLLVNANEDQCGILMSRFRCKPTKGTFN